MWNVRIHMKYFIQWFWGVCCDRHVISFYLFYLNFDTHNQTAITSRLDETVCCPQETDHSRSDSQSTITLAWRHRILSPYWSPINFNLSGMKWHAGAIPIGHKLHKFTDLKSKLIQMHVINKNLKFKIALNNITE